MASVMAEDEKKKGQVIFMRYFMNDVDYELVTVFDKPTMFTELRIVRDTVPDGLYMYEVRSDSNGDPVQFGQNILVDFCGTIITNEPIKLQSDGLLDINPDEDWNVLCATITPEEFQDAAELSNIMDELEV